jgi:hypothetical protein
MNLTLISRIYSFQFVSKDSFQLVSNDRELDSSPSEPDRVSSVPPAPDTDTDYDLIQLCEDLAEIDPYNRPTS